MRTTPKTKGTQPVKKPSRLLRALPYLLLIGMAAGTATYCVSWHFQASFAAANVERLIADINARQKLITYSAIETEGFPMDVTVRVLQPKFSGRVDQLIRAAYAASANPNVPRNEEMEKALAALPEWVEEVSVAGSLDLGVNFFSDHYTLTLNGPLTQTSVINQARYSLSTQPRGPLTCSLKLARTHGLLSDLWNTGRLTRNTPETLMRDFRMVECNSPGYLMTDGESKETLLNAGPFGMRFATQRLADKTRHVELAVRAVDFEVSPRMNAVTNRYLALFSSAENIPGSDIAAYGKQNIDIALLMRGPIDLKGFSEDVPFIISIPRFNFQNALYSTVSRLQIENRISSDARAITLVVDSDSSFSKNYDRYLMDYARILLNQIRSSADPELSDLKGALDALTPEQTTKLLEQVIPRLQSFGNIGVHINAGVQGDRVLHRGNLTLDRFDITTTPYAISAKGKSALPGDGGTLKDANFSLTCRNCSMMVDDLSHYVTRMQTALASLDNEMAGAPPYFSSALAQGIKNFLSTIGTRSQEGEGGAETLTFVLASDAEGNLTLNGKPPSVIMQLFGTHIAPNLNFGQPPAEPAANAY